ncbi:hypothetical protein C8R43DRAFT_1231157 [Mycena crocata]|nr:hypothetical protein C8R43DRAFT_1231157 [Mycena crocata]
MPPPVNPRTNNICPDCSNWIKPKQRQDGVWYLRVCFSPLLKLAVNKTTRIVLESHCPSAGVAMFYSEVSRSEAADSDPASVPFSPKPKTALHSRYSTNVFDVLQTYCGLPLLEKLAPGEETVIKMCAKERPALDDMSVSQGSHGDGSSSAPSSSMSKKRSVKGGKGKASTEAPVLKLSLEDSAQKILVAATIERWIAQLTSDLNYDELLNFFLTYHTYISTVDLSLPLGATAADVDAIRDGASRRSFLPDRELRILVSHWLNTLIRDPILTKHVDGLSIVSKLKKVAKDCKKVHTRAPSKPKEPTPTATKAASETQGHSKKKIPMLTWEQALPEAPSDYTGSDLANAHLSTVHPGSSTRASSMPLSSLSILQRTDHLAAESNTMAPFVQSPATLPIHHSALLRVFVKTIGRLSTHPTLLSRRRDPMTVCSAASVN